MKRSGLSASYKKGASYGPHTYASYVGGLVKGKMETKGTYRFDNGSIYTGEFKDGAFHGKGTLTFKNGTRYEGCWENGCVKSGFLVFDDGLPFEPNDDLLNGWHYLNPVWDRRFFSEVKDGLRSRYLRTRDSDHLGNPIHSLPTGCYDTCDGFYDPETKTVYHYLDPEITHDEANDRGKWTFLRYIRDEEDVWIKEKARREKDWFVGYSIPGVMDDRPIASQVAKTAIKKRGQFCKKADIETTAKWLKLREAMKKYL